MWLGPGWSSLSCSASAQCIFPVVLVKPRAGRQQAHGVADGLQELLMHFTF